MQISIYYDLDTSRVVCVKNSYEPPAGDLLLFGIVTPSMMDGSGLLEQLVSTLSMIEGAAAGFHDALHPINFLPPREESAPKEGEKGGGTIGG